MTHYIMGFDEVGLGAWAGPLVVCGVLAPDGWTLEGLDDSKAVKSRDAREALLHRLNEERLYVSIQEIDSRELDQLTVRPAWEKAMRRSYSALTQHYKTIVDCVIDGDKTISGIPARALPKADHLIPAVSAASIYAKTYRDWLMELLGAQYPGYGFDSNAGYGTQEHQHGLARQGVCPEHRRSYRPIRELIELQGKTT